MDHLRAHSHSAMYSTSMCPPVAEQVIRAMKCVMGLDGSKQGRSCLLTVMGLGGTEVIHPDDIDETRPANEQNML